MPKGSLCTCWGSSPKSELLTKGSTCNLTFTQQGMSSTQLQCCQAALDTSYRNLSGAQRQGHRTRKAMNSTQHKWQAGALNAMKSTVYTLEFNRWSLSSHWFWESLGRPGGWLYRQRLPSTSQSDPDSREGKLTPRGHPLTSVHTSLLHTSCAHTTWHKIVLFQESAYLGVGAQLKSTQPNLKDLDTGYSAASAHAGARGTSNPFLW